MKKPQVVCTAYIIDTYRSSGVYKPGAITFLGRKKIEAIQWPKTFETQHDADSFVRQHFVPLGIPEALNEGEVRKKE